MPSTRRAVLASAVAGCAALAGCSTRLRSPSPDDPPASGVDEPPDPSRHVFGANGEWSSFGCNAGNTRAVADGKAPVDGVNERWRVETTQTTYHAPVVADGIVYLFESQRTLRALDSAAGDELWTFEDATAAPLVRDGVAYVSTSGAVHALDTETGDRLWEREFETPGTVTTPATYGGDELVCGAGEQVVGLEADSGSVAWRRDAFGQVLHHTAVFQGHWNVVATEAGMVYLLGTEGVGHRRWQLPAPPMCPPTAGRDAVYVSCRDGVTYALSDDDGYADDVYWTAETGWTERGIALADGLVFLRGHGTLHALEAGTGQRAWEHAIGDWRHTAPAYGRETVFVGGDALYALDATPGGSPDGGPARRFRRSFAGRVGPGPVLDDGTLYVVAEVEAETYALLALE